jgi:hypothetical protein
LEVVTLAVVKTFSVAPLLMVISAGLCHVSPPSVDTWKEHMSPDSRLVPLTVALTTKLSHSPLPGTTTVSVVVPPSAPELIRTVPSRVMYVSAPALADVVANVQFAMSATLVTGPTVNSGVVSMVVVVVVVGVVVMVVLVVVR